MAEFTKKFWRCDNCGREVQRGVMPPPGWFEAGYDGEVFHCCFDPSCRAWCLRCMKAEYPVQCREQIKELEAACPPT